MGREGDWNICSPQGTSILSMYYGHNKPGMFTKCWIQFFAYILTIQRHAITKYHSRQQTRNKHRQILPP